MSISSSPDKSSIIGICSVVVVVDGEASSEWITPASISVSSSPLPSLSSELRFGQFSSSSPFGQFLVPSHFWISQMKTEVFPHLNLSSPRQSSTIVLSSSSSSSISSSSFFSSSFSSALSSSSSSVDLGSSLSTDKLFSSSLLIGPSSSSSIVWVVVVSGSSMSVSVSSSSVFTALRVSRYSLSVR